MQALWRELPAHELRKECQDQGVSAGGLVGCHLSSEEEQPKELLERLILANCADLWQTQGLPLKRVATVLGSFLGILSCEHGAKEFVRLQAADDRTLLEEYKRLEIPTQASDSESCRYTPHSWNSARKVPSIVSGSYGSIPNKASRKQRVQAETPTKRRELLQRLQRVAAWRARSLGCEEGRSLEFS
ncbi:unnamed protein product [Symbiodinium necroappetens]|uniref:Uncharacterized protein n=1 Tax=Symbiodinium necroappetens TaxID=1628268 RepID=A0A813A6N7_9DINO|nr:unnamed protein product [Symbiodinium necroappetens]